jgi:cellobiose-specific phosphotransferase system component IIB
MRPLVRILAMLLLVTGSLTLLHAQVGLGLRGGINLAKAEIEVANVSIDNDYNLGITAALFAEIGVTDIFAIQPELSFIQKGLKNTIEDDGKYELKLFINYLEVPVLTKWMFGTEMVKAHLLLGPTVGYALDGFEKIDGEKEDLDLDEMNRVDFGAMAGVGVDFAINGGSLFIDARYGLGISNMYKDEDAKNATWKTRGINIGVGYIYRFGK